MTRTGKQSWSWKTGSPEKKERMAVFLEWLLSPVGERVPATKRELAEDLGVSTQSLRNYQRDPWFQREYIQRSRALNRVERASDVLDSLYDQAVDPQNPRSVAAAKAWLDWVNQAAEVSLPTDIADLDDEQLYQLVMDAAAARSGE